MNQPVAVQLLPDTGFVRIRQIVGDRKRGILPLIPICRSVWYQGIRENLTRRAFCSALALVWTVESIKVLIASTSAAVR
jgi:prophage regulatory protein